MKKILLSVIVLGMIILAGGVVNSIQECPMYDSEWQDIDSSIVSTSGTAFYFEGTDSWYIDEGDGVLTIALPTLESSEDYLFSVKYKIGTGNDNDTEDFEIVCGGETFEFPDDVFGDNPQVVEKTITCQLNLGENNVSFISTNTGSVHLLEYRVQGENCPVPTSCEVIVDQPIAGETYGLNHLTNNETLSVNWHYEGACYPLKYILAYQQGNCNGDAWISFANLNPTGNNSNTYGWDVSDMQSGEYCILANMYQTGTPYPMPIVGGVSGVFNLDLAAPEVNMSVAGPQHGDCSEGPEEGYVTQSTQIILSCSDDKPDEDWQSGVHDIHYKINGGEVKTIFDDSIGFSFEEDGIQQIEYWCHDNVGEVSEKKSKTFVVGSVGPEIERTVQGPQECIGEECYFNLDTEICVTATESTFDLDTLECRWSWDDLLETQGNVGWFEVDGCFSYTEDSWHTLECRATDLLGNINTVIWQDIVDAKAPNTNLVYSQPYYEFEGVQWINTESTVILNAEDSTPHPVGEVTTHYRYGIVEDSYCYREIPLEDLDENLVVWEQNWTQYNNPFGLSESCHLIEYYSVDGLNNMEEVKQELVFSDHTAPILNFDVSPSGESCDNPLSGCEPAWDWKVTTDTEIVASCNDAEPHPSGVSELCYKVTWDGGEASESYYQGGYYTEDGFYCVDSNELRMSFGEECEHSLEFYCKDNVNKTSESMKNVFKVIGQEFRIELDKKWNLISVPVNLLNSDVHEVFSDSAIEEVWSYEDGNWYYYKPQDNSSTLDRIVPGKGYWVKTSNSSEIVVGGSLFEEAKLPNSVQLSEGWNLIGHYGLPSKPAYCSLFSLVDTSVGYPKWSALLGYKMGSFFELNALNPSDETQAGEGYWIAMNNEEMYNYATTCWGFPSMS